MGFDIGPLYCVNINASNTPHKSGVPVNEGITEAGVFGEGRLLALVGYVLLECETVAFVEKSCIAVVEVCMPACCWGVGEGEKFNRAVCGWVSDLIVEGLCLELVDVVGALTC